MYRVAADLLEAGLLLARFDKEERGVSLHFKATHRQVVQLAIHLGHEDRVAELPGEGLQLGHHLLAVRAFLVVKHQNAMAPLVEDHLDEVSQDHCQNWASLHARWFLGAKLTQKTLHAGLGLRGLGLAAGDLHLLHEALQGVQASCLHLLNLCRLWAEVENRWKAGVVEAIKRNAIGFSVQLRQHQVSPFILHLPGEVFIDGSKLLAVSTPRCIDLQHDVLSSRQGSIEHLPKVGSDHREHRTGLFFWNWRRAHQLLCEPKCEFVCAASPGAARPQHCGLVDLSGLLQQSPPRRQGILQRLRWRCACAATRAAGLFARRLLGRIQDQPQQQSILMALEHLHGLLRFFHQHDCRPGVLPHEVFKAFTFFIQAIGCEVSPREIHLGLPRVTDGGHCLVAGNPVGLEVHLSFLCQTLKCWHHVLRPQ
mmetsp:Transcript_44854/g.71258  ORF Transcript_44854/g.71258 Transcript_44854/m.71258 type:complete len:424 (+) Transcript_44854:107-1378(+)